MKSGKKGKKLYPVMLPKSALKALDRLCVMRKIDPDKEDRHACAVMALILDALMVETRAEHSRSQERKLREERDRRRKAELLKLN